MDLTNKELLAFIKDCYDKGYTQARIAQELTTLTVPAPNASNHWDARTVCCIALSAGLRRHQKVTRQASAIIADPPEERAAKVNLGLLGKILQNEAFTESEKRKLLSALA